MLLPDAAGSPARRRLAHRLDCLGEIADVLETLVYRGKANIRHLVDTQQLFHHHLAPVLMAATGGGGECCRLPRFRGYPPPGCCRRCRMDLVSGLRSDD